MKMQAKEITKQVKLAIKKGYDAIIVNYSNPDMIGHTGDYLATVKALGLKKIRDVAVHNDTPQIRGMIKKVSHLVEVEEN